MEIEINNLEKSYNKIEVLNISSLSIKKGEVFGLVGNNGAGKTTFIRLLLDLIQSASGEVLINGKKVGKYESWKDKTASFIDDTFLIPFLSPEEYFDIIAEVYGINAELLTERLNRFHDFFANEILKKKKLIRDYSQGNKRKIGIIAALIVNPQLLVLDEPFANLDPSSQLHLVKMLNAIKQIENPTMVISSHNLEHVTSVCERIAIIEHGKIVEDYNVNRDSIEKIKTYFSV